MAIAFMGYVLPFGQMSFWGATVITNLLSPFPSLIEVNNVRSVMIQYESSFWINAQDLIH